MSRHSFREMFAALLEGLMKAHESRVLEGFLRNVSRTLA
jgi:hypothetical protein